MLSDHAGAIKGVQEQIKGTDRRLGERLALFEQVSQDAELDAPLRNVLKSCEQAVHSVQKIRSSASPGKARTNDDLGFKIITKIHGHTTI